MCKPSRERCRGRQHNERPLTCLRRRPRRRSASRVRARFKQPRSLCARHRQRHLVEPLEWGNLVELATLGGALTSSPAATSPGNGLIDVFVRGTDNALWERKTTNGGTTWSSWYKIGGQILAGTDPAVCAQNANSLDVFVQGTDDILYYTQWDGTTWSGWKSLGGGLTTSPAVTSQANGMIDVFVRGTDNAIWYREYIGELLVKLERPRRAGCLRHRTSGLLMERRSSRRLCARARMASYTKRRGPAHRGPSGNPSAENSPRHPLRRHRPAA